MDTVWKLTAVTLAAQVLTTPVSMYHFHQFPVYFVFTNLLAVPLSGLIVLLEIGLCVVGALPVLATATGSLLHALIAGMNSFIEYMERLPFSLWGGMQINLLQVVLLYGLITATTCWLLWKHQPAFFTGLACLLGFLSLRSWSFIVAGDQQELVVYNTPKHQAIDFISGRNYFFIGDDDPAKDIQPTNYQLAPSRILYRTSASGSLENLLYTKPVYLFNNKKIVVVNKAFPYQQMDEKIDVDLIIVSKNANVQLARLLTIFHCKRVVLDASNSAAKVHKWKTEAAKLGLYCFSVVDNGAFVMNVD